MAEARTHRALITFVQRASWLLGQGLRLRFSIPPSGSWVPGRLAIPERLDLEEGAEWLRRRTGELARARLRNGAARLSGKR